MNHQSIRLIAHPWAKDEVADYLKQCTGLGYKTRWTQGLANLDKEFVLCGPKFELESISSQLKERIESFEEA